MMSVVAAFSLLAVCLAGCAPAKGPMSPGEACVAAGDGLSLTVRLPRTGFLVGERFEAVLVARNDGYRTIEVQARSSAPVYAVVQRHTGGDWEGSSRRSMSRRGPEAVKRYPQAAVMFLNNWTLAPGQQRTFVLGLAVEPDWPVAEPLRLAFELNGRRDVSPAVPIFVRARSATAERFGRG